METYSIDHPEKGLIEYTDGKRRLWTASIALPLAALSGIAIYYWLGKAEWALVTPLLFIYGIVPALDYLLGSDENNPPEELVPQLENDSYYRVRLKDCSS